jgi:glycosyltransferase involved in cell wall biosynthesis
VRILVVNHYAVPPRAGGGTRHADLARRWAQHGHAVRIIGSSFSHVTQGSGARLPSRTQLAPGVELRSLWTPGYAGNGPRRAADMAWFGVAAAATGLTAERPDVVLGSSPHPLAAAAALTAAARHRVPFVLEIRDLWPQTLVDLGGLAAHGAVTRTLYRLEAALVGRAAATVVVPPAAGTYLGERGMEVRRLVHIPNGVDPAGDAAATTGAGTRLVAEIGRLRAAGRTVLVYAGSDGMANGVDVLVRAAAAAGPVVHLVVVGDGPHRGRTEAAAAGTGAVNVTLGGQLPKADARAVVGAADAAVFHLHDAPVFRYGLSPNKLFDYLSSGRPVLYAGPAVPNPATAAGTPVVAPPGDVGAIAEAMLQLARMPATERARRGQAGREFVAAEHSLDVLAQRYLSLFEELA